MSVTVQGTVLGTVLSSFLFPSRTIRGTQLVEWTSPAFTHLDSVEHSEVQHNRRITKNKRCDRTRRQATAETPERWW